MIGFSEQTNTHTLKSLDQVGNVLYISSLSKLVASGLRIGWIIGPDNVINRLADAKQQIDFGHSILPQWASEQFLKSDLFDIHLKQLRNSLVRKRNLLVSCLQEHLIDHLEFQIPEGGIHLWCHLKHDVNVYRLLESALRNGVAFVPGNLLGSSNEHIRLTFGRAETHLIKEGIIRLKKSFLEDTNMSSSSQNNS